VLTEPRDLSAQLRASPQQACVVRFSTESIGLTAKFLGKEIEPLAGRAAPCRAIAVGGGDFYRCGDIFKTLSLLRDWLVLAPSIATGKHI
jgi:hypothetical protein